MTRLARALKCGSFGARGPTASARAEKKRTYDGALRPKDVVVSMEVVNSSANGLGMPLPKGIVRVYKKGTDESLGTYLVSVFLSDAEQVEVGDKQFAVSLRFKRYYKPYRVHLDKFRFDHAAFRRCTRHDRIS